MGWAAWALSAIEAAAKAQASWEEREFRGETLDRLADVQSQLRQLRKDIADIRKQNHQILRRLDTLVGEVVAEFSEVLDEALLRERYVVVRDLRDNFLLIRGGRPFSVESASFARFSSSMLYLFENEHRPSRHLELIEACEIALAITKGRSAPLVEHWLDQKLEDWHSTLEALVARVEEKFAVLERLLQDRKYVSSHNISGPATLEDARVHPAPDRTKTKKYRKEECTTTMVGSGPGRRRARVCRMVEKKKQVPDKAFNGRKRAHIKRANSVLHALREDVVASGALTSAIRVLQKYRTGLEDDPRLPEPGASLITLFGENEAAESPGDLADAPQELFSYLNSGVASEGEHGSAESVDGFVMLPVDFSDPT